MNLDVDNVKFVRRIDKSGIPTCSIMGVNIAAIDIEWLLDYTIENLDDLSGDYMCVSNVHTTVMSWDDKKYLEIQNGGIMAIPDGGPLSVVGRNRGFKNMKRIAGPSYMEKIFEISEKMGYRHFFYGSKQETLDKLYDELTFKYKGINIVGMYSPPYRELTEVEDVNIINIINETSADFVWVGLGAPKQEAWMANHQGKINGFMVGVGAGFDYFAGNIKRAPKWMQNMNLEWLYRLCQEPKRLFKRYLYTNTKFIWYVLVRGK